MPRSWHGLLESARDEHAVIALVRDFVACLDPAEANALPPQCRPGKFFDANDVTSFAFDVVRHECAPDAAAEAVVHKLAAFFSHASIRLSELAARAAVPDAAPGVEKADSVSR